MRGEFEYRELDSDYGFVELPAVIQGRNTSHIGLAS